MQPHFSPGITRVKRKGTKQNASVNGGTDKQSRSLAHRMVAYLTVKGIKVSSNIEGGDEGEDLAR